MRPARALVFAAFLALAPGAAGAGSFADGAQAFDGGDFQGAVETWRALAEAGDAEAQLALAGVYRFGQGIPVDLTQAARWYEAAARVGIPIAMVNLAEMIEAGQGVSRDPVAALAWMSLAAQRGHAWAKAESARLANRLGQVDRARARALAGSIGVARK
jgi:TPR repeat protein